MALANMQTSSACAIGINDLPALTGAASGSPRAVSGRKRQSPGCRLRLSRMNAGERTVSVKHARQCVLRAFSILDGHLQRAAEWICTSGSAEAESKGRGSGRVWGARQESKIET